MLSHIYIYIYIYIYICVYDIYNILTCKIPIEFGLGIVFLNDLADFKDKKPINEMAFNPFNGFQLN